jgi:gliding motility-associated-like protein
MKGERIEFTATKEVKVRMKLTHGDDKNLNATTEWSTINVVEADKPELTVNITEKNTKTYVVLSNTNANVEHLVWRVDGKVCQGQSCATYMTQKGGHSYTVESYDMNGCFASTNGVVNIDEDYNLYVENTFTPNGDGINDTWNISGLNQPDAMLYIFDRYGKLLKQLSATDSSQGWDGTHNQQLLPSTDYWFTLDYTENGVAKQFKAHFSLNR